MAATTSRPARSARTSSRATRACWRTVISRCAYSTSALPASVKPPRRAGRSNSRWPISSSSRPMTWLMAGCVRPRALAASGEAALLDDGQEGLELVDIHKLNPSSSAASAATRWYGLTWSVSIHHLDLFSNSPLVQSRHEQRTPADVTVFDTTLRDGEQAPGFSMSPADKVRLASQLERLGVDVIEAGFPIASAADFEGVAAVARAVRRAGVAALARAVARGRLDGLGTPCASQRAPAHARLPRHLGSPPVGQAAHLPRRMPRPGGGGGAAGSGPVRRRRVLRRRRHAQRSRLPVRGRRGGGRRRGHHHQPARHGRLRAARRHHPDVRGRGRRVGAGRGALGPLPQRPRPGRRQLAGRRAGRGAPGGVHHQRHRRTRRQRGARRNRHGPRGARRCPRLRAPVS